MALSLPYMALVLLYVMVGEGLCALNPSGALERDALLEASRGEGLSLRLRHRHAKLPGSSHGGRAMTWRHFEMLRKHDRDRQLSLGRRRGQGSGRSVEEVEYSLGGNADPNIAG